MRHDDVLSPAPAPGLAGLVANILSHPAGKQARERGRGRGGEGGTQEPDQGSMTVVVAALLRGNHDHHMTVMKCSQ